MIRLGIIGTHLTHTKSPLIYNTLFQRYGMDSHYDIIEIAQEAFDSQIDRWMEELYGFNVTIPYKSRIIPHLKCISEDAMTIGAVNVINSKGEGFNTDWQGFYRSLEGIEIKGESAIVIGAGGAARAVCFALKKAGLEIYVKDRKVERASELEKIFGAHLETPDPATVGLIVNATPLGMYPDTDSSPDLSIEKFRRSCVIYDLVYNPAETKFLRNASSLGFKTLNGYCMLVNQAVLNLKIWSMEALAETLLKDHSWIS
jgi:shikimate dehydrogenase